MKCFWRAKHREHAFDQMANNRASRFIFDGYQNENRVRWSMTERMKRFPCDKLLYSTRSTATHWNASVTGRCPTGNLGGRWEDLRCWQDRHVSIWVRTSVDIVGPQNLSRMVSNVALKAKWPPDAGRSWHELMTIFSEICRHYQLIAESATLH